MSRDSDSDSYNSSMPSLETASESSFTSASDSDSTDPNMPALALPDSSHSGSLANSSDSGENAASDGDDDGVGVGVRPQLSSDAHVDGVATPQLSLTDSGTADVATQRSGRGLRATAMNGAFRSWFLEDRLRGATPPAAGGAQGEQPERFLNPVSAEFIEIGRDLFHLGRQQRRIEQVKRRLIERALELIRTNPWLDGKGQESEQSFDGGERESEPSVED